MSCISLLPHLSVIMPPALQESCLPDLAVIKAEADVQSIRTAAAEAWKKQMILLILRQRKYFILFKV
uniref:Uncharacterized protein n=1 Tax=Oryza sativa subsp. japonica TaxID=39947 RepID=Q6H708_ORYSJ|nr:hypothetical protein [Oryza sativa Japonica Group]BAD25491.1 hypothetical protein [Oryza sativa Japonica Group]